MQAPSWLSLLILLYPSINHSVHGHTWLRAGVWHKPIKDCNGKPRSTSPENQLLWLWHGRKQIIRNLNISTAPMGCKQGATWRVVSGENCFAQILRKTKNDGSALLHIGSHFWSSKSAHLSKWPACLSQNRMGLSCSFSFLALDVLNWKQSQKSPYQLSYKITYHVPTLQVANIVPKTKRKI